MVIEDVLKQQKEVPGRKAIAGAIGRSRTSIKCSTHWSGNGPSEYSDIRVPRKDCPVRAI